MDLAHDITIYPVQADLTSNGVQYSTEIETTTVDTDVVAFCGEFDMGVVADPFQDKSSLPIIWIYFDLVIMLKANSSATADIKWKAQGRDKDGTWTDLFSWVTYTDIGTTYAEKEYKGYAELGDDFSNVPFDYRIIFQCNERDEGRAKMKNTTYFRTVFKDIT